MKYELRKDYLYLFWDLSFKHNDDSFLDVGYKLFDTLAKNTFSKVVQNTRLEDNVYLKALDEGGIQIILINDDFNSNDIVLLFKYLAHAACDVYKVMIESELSDVEIKLNVISFNDGECDSDTIVINKDTDIDEMFAWSRESTSVGSDSQLKKEALKELINIVKDHNQVIYEQLKEEYCNRYELNDDDKTDMENKVYELLGRILKIGEKLKKVEDLIQDVVKVQEELENGKE